MLMKKQIAKFLNSIYFIILINILGLVFWYLQNPLYSYMMYLVSLILIILFDARRIVISTLLLNGLIAYRIVSTPEYQELYKNNFITFTTLTVLGVSVVVYDLFFRRKVKFSLKNPIIYGMLAVVLTNLLSIVNATRDTIQIIFVGFLQAGAFLLIFVFIDHLKDDDADNYFSTAGLITGISITLQILIHLLREPNDYRTLFFPLGWGNRNTISIMYMILVPLTFYPYFKDQKNIHNLISCGIFLSMTVLMLSRGAYLTMGLLIIPFLIMTYKRINDQRKYIIDLLKTVGIGLAFALIMVFGFKQHEFFYDHIVNKLIKEPFNPSGRIELFTIGIDVFKKYPLFGGGSFTGAYFLQTLNGRDVATYHNYIIHALATTGIVGLASFIFYLCTVFKNLDIKNQFNFCILFVMLNLLVHGLFDNTFYNALFMVFLSLLLPLIKPTETIFNQNLNEND